MIACSFRYARDLLCMLFVAAAVMSVATACTPSGADSSGPPDTDEGTTVEFDPANFVDPTLDTNPFHPLRPGLQGAAVGRLRWGRGWYPSRSSRR